MNAAIEPLRAAKQLATTLEAEVLLSAPASVVRKLAPFRSELAGFLMVARAEVAEAPDRPELSVSVRRTAWLKCERCWTHRPEVRSDGTDPGLCGRCVAVLGIRREK